MTSDLELTPAAVEAGSAPIDPNLQHKVDLIVLSYRYSQGDSVLGGKILSHAVHANTEIFPEGTIPADAIDAAVPIVKQIHYRAHPQYDLNQIEPLSEPLDEDTVTESIASQVANTESYNPSSREIQPRSIAQHILERDAIFLLDTNPSRGRDKPGRLPNGRSQAQDGTFLSHYCYYGLTGHWAGSEEYKKMFTAISAPAVIRLIAEFDRTSREGPDPLDRFEQVLLTHFRHFGDDLDLISKAKIAALREVVRKSVAKALFD
jgi:hypothetical protein